MASLATSRLVTRTRGFMFSAVACVSAAAFSAASSPLVVFPPGQLRAKYLESRRHGVRAILSAAEERRNIICNAIRVSNTSNKQK